MRFCIFKGEENHKKGRSMMYKKGIRTVVSVLVAAAFVVVIVLFFDLIPNESEPPIAEPPEEQSGETLPEQLTRPTVSNLYFSTEPEEWYSTDEVLSYNGLATCRVVECTVLEEFPDSTGEYVRMCVPYLSDDYTEYEQFMEEYDRILVKLIVEIVCTGSYSGTVDGWHQLDPTFSTASGNIFQFTTYDPQTGAMYDTGYKPLADGTTPRDKDGNVLYRDHLGDEMSWDMQIGDRLLLEMIRIIPAQEWETKCVLLTPFCGQPGGTDWMLQLGYTQPHFWLNEKK